MLTLTHDSSPFPPLYICNNVCTPSSSDLSLLLSPPLSSSLLRVHRSGYDLVRGRLVKRGGDPIGQTGPSGGFGVGKKSHTAAESATGRHAYDMDLEVTQGGQRDAADAANAADYRTQGECILSGRDVPRSGPKASSFTVSGKAYRGKDGGIRVEFLQLKEHSQVDCTAVYSFRSDTMEGRWRSTSGNTGFFRCVKRVERVEDVAPSAPPRPVVPIVRGPVFRRGF